MKRCLLLVILCLLTFAQKGYSREVHNINRNWRFFSDIETSSDAAQTVNLPHIWSSDALGGKKDYFRGVGNYLKNINIPYSWKGKRIFIKLYGVNSTANLIVNGSHVGQHHGGYTAFTLELTDYLDYGTTNALWVIVNNSPRLDVLPTAGDANVYGGIFRDIEIILTENEFVCDLEMGSSGVRIVNNLVSDNMVSATAHLTVNSKQAVDMTASITGVNSEGKQVVNQKTNFKTKANSVTQVELDFQITNPQLWNGTQDAHLYNFYVKLYDQDEVLKDSLMVRTGFKTCSVDPEQGFMLNGKPYPIKGVYVTQDRATSGPALTIYQILEDVNLIREMGANMVRVMGVPHSPYFYDMCDEYGILVWSEVPFMGADFLTDLDFLNTRSFMDNGKRQLREIIHQQYNNPSIAMWGIFSRVSTKGDSPVRFIQELNDIAKAEDASRMTVASSDNDGRINFITDLIVWDHSFGWSAGSSSDINTWLGQLNRRWSNLKSAISYKAGASIYHQDDNVTRPDMYGNWHPERWQTKVHEEYYDLLKGDKILWAKFVSNMFDYGAVSRTWGEGTGINDVGLVTFDRKYCKDAYYFYKANWNTDEPFVYIAERRWLLRNKLVQNFKVYSPCEDVELKYGRNIIQARSGSLIDRIEVEVGDSEEFNLTGN